jgi:hypothetical protein
MTEDPILTPAPEDLEQPGRRLWPRFSLSVTAFVLLILSSESFGILASSFSERGKLAPLPLIAFLGFGIGAGFAFGLAVVSPRSIALRHPRRGLTLALIPAVVTTLNVILALAPQSLPDGLGQFTARYLIGLQTISSVFLGIAAAAAVAEE